MRSSLTRLPLYAVLLRDPDGAGGFTGAAVAARGLTREAAELAAAKVNEDGIFEAVIRPMKWGIVKVA